MLYRELILNFINIFANIYFVLIFIRIILSFFPTGLPRTRLFIFDVTEPLLAPIRKIVPPLGGVLDLSPILLYLILELLVEIITRLIG